MSCLNGEQYPRNTRSSLTDWVARIANRSIFCDEPFVVVLGVLAVLVTTLERICHSIYAILAESFGKLLVVIASSQRVSDLVRRSNEFDFDAE